MQQGEKTGYSYSAPSGYSYLSTFTQTFLAGGCYVQSEEVETITNNLKNKGRIQA